jgi:hypothetical protein
MGRVPRLRAPPGHGGAREFLLFVTNPPRGRPFGGGGTHRHIVPGVTDTICFIFHKKRIFSQTKSPSYIIRIGSAFMYSRQTVVA